MTFNLVCAARAITLEPPLLLPYNIIVEDEYALLLVWHKEVVFKKYERNVAAVLHMDAIDWVTKTKALDKRLKKRNERI